MAGAARSVDRLDRAVAARHAGDARVAGHDRLDAGADQRRLRPQERNLAIVSDAGSPGISDPAFTLVRAAVEAGIAIVPVPGPSSALCALEVSGLPTDRFAFEGFLPRKSGRRRTRIEELRGDPRTLIFFESPHRLRATLSDLLDGLGNRPASVSRELTKKFEETRRAPLTELAAWAASKTPRGEFVIVVGGAPRGKDAAAEAEGEEEEDA